MTLASNDKAIEDCRFLLGTLKRRIAATQRIDEKLHTACLKRIEKWCVELDNLEEFHRDAGNRRHLFPIMVNDKPLFSSYIMNQGASGSTCWSPLIC